MASERLAPVLALGYLLLPNSHHRLLEGIPLSITATAALVLALAAFVLPRPVGRWSRAAVALFSVAIVIKAAIAFALPARGFDAAYFANERPEGQPRHRVDQEITFDVRTFPREFFNEREFMSSAYPEGLPFSAVWRGAIALENPTSLTIHATASEPVTVSVDGQPFVAGMPLQGSHEVAVSFARTTSAPPAIHVALLATDRSGRQGDPLPVFTGQISVAQARFAGMYRRFSILLDILMFAAILGLAGRGLAAAFAMPRADRRLPPFAAVGFAVVVLWFGLGVVRTAADFDTMEFLQRGDDWLGYEAAARNVLRGDFVGAAGRLGYSSFLYPYYLAGLHGVFGERIWPVYFAQHLAFGLTCVLLGLLGRALWGPASGLAVLITATVVGGLDMGRWYLIRFLGENLGLLLLPLLFLALHRYCAAPGLTPGLTAGAMLGLAVLARFNLLPFAAVAVAYVVLYRGRTGTGSAAAARIAFAGAFAATFGLFPLREYIAAGTWALVPIGASLTYAGQPGSILERFQEGWTAPLTSVVLPNIAFILGYPKFAAPVYSIRPHWLLLWLAYAAWVWSHRQERSSGIIWLLHAYVLTYLAVMLPNGFIWGYGYRYLLLLVFVLCVFFPPGAQALTHWVGRWRARRAAVRSTP